MARDAKARKAAVAEQPAVEDPQAAEPTPIESRRKRKPAVEVTIQDDGTASVE
jgi:hypothetical protein